MTKQLGLVEFEELLPRSGSIYTILRIVELCFNSRKKDLKRPQAKRSTWQQTSLISCLNTNEFKLEFFLNFGKNFLNIFLMQNCRILLDCLGLGTNAKVW